MHQRSKIILTVLASLVLLLVLVNILLVLGNQSIQAEVSERHQFVSHAMQLEALNQQVVSVLIDVAVKTNDTQLQQLLASIGISVLPTSQPPSGSK